MAAALERLASHWIPDKFSQIMGRQTLSDCSNQLILHHWFNVVNDCWWVIWLLQMRREHFHCYPMANPFLSHWLPLQTCSFNSFEISFVDSNTSCPSLLAFGDCSRTRDLLSTSLLASSLSDDPCSSIRGKMGLNMEYWAFTPNMLWLWKFVALAKLGYGVAKFPVGSQGWNNVESLYTTS